MGWLVVRQTDPTPYPVTAVGKPRLQGGTGGAQENPGRGGILPESLSCHRNLSNAIPIVSHHHLIMWGISVSVDMQATLMFSILHEM